MLETDMKCQYFLSLLQLSAVQFGIVVLGVTTAAAQDSAPVAPPTAPKVSAIQLGRFSDKTAFSATTSADSRQALANGVPASEATGSPSTTTGGGPIRSDRIRRITLEQVRDSVSAAIGPMARLGQLQIEVAKQHRLATQADYFPKFGAMFGNLHYTEFLGNILTVPRPRLGKTSDVPIPLFSQDQTFAWLTFTQPITPLLMVHQAVRIARADERIAMAKAGVSVSKNAREADIEETYFKLLIAQRQVTSAELKLKQSQSQPLYSTVSVTSVLESGPPEEGYVEANKELAGALTKVRELTTSVNRALGWPDDTELELTRPDPLVETISLDEVADKFVAGNLEVIEAEENVVKARAAYTISKLAYVPTVAAVAGYLFQNAVPLLPNNFGYGGVMASYNLFDFGKREHSIKEAHAQLDMAELALQMTKAKVAANVKKSHFELERTRQISHIAQKMGSIVAFAMKVSSLSESLEAKAARADVEVEMLESDLAHRQAFARLKASIGSQQ